MASRLNILVKQERSQERSFLSIYLKHMMSISVIGAGYVGLANAILLSQAHPTLLFDIDTQRIQRLMQGRSPIKDPLIESYLTNSSLQLRFSDDENEAYQASDLILIATPTNYDPYRDAFDTKSVEEAIHKACAHNPQATIVIKSTIPIGFSERMQAQYPHACILFSPEFLREGQALHDNLHPSRIIVGAVKEAHLPKAQMVAHLLQEGALEDAPIIVTGANDAECIKLFANAYLAMRVSFFNELDSFAATHQLNTRAIIEGIGLDPRIGMHYNNPSFGFGGYCLPKDSMQLRQQFQQANIPCALIPAIVESNQKRKKFYYQSYC